MSQQYNKVKLLATCLIFVLCFLVLPGVIYGRVKEKVILWDASTGHSHDGSTEGKKVDLSTIDGDIIPLTDSIYDLGSITKKWKDLYLSGTSLYLGTQLIKLDSVDGGIGIGNRLHLETEDGISGSVCFHPGTNPEANPTGYRLWADGDELRYLLPNASPTTYINHKFVKEDENGNVIIGAIGTPSARLDVEEGAVLFQGNTGVTPISGAGYRFMWIPERYALRAGYVTGDQWDDNNIGDGSLAVGSNVEASWYDAVALGYANSSTNSAAFSMGRNNLASGALSVCTGDASVSSGKVSHAHGYNVTAESYCEVVIGKYNVLSGGTNSSWVDTDPIFVIGNGIDSGNRNNALTILKNGNVDITGNVNVIGDVIVPFPSDITHATTSKVLVLSSVQAVFPVSDAARFSMINYSYCAEIEPSSTDGLYDYAVIPIDLPSGVVITGITMYGKRISGNATVSVYMGYLGYNDTIATNFGNCSLSGTGDGINCVNSSLNQTVSSNNRYYIRIYLEHNAVNEAGFYSAKIAYASLNLGQTR